MFFVSICIMFFNIVQIGAFNGNDKVYDILKKEITAKALLIEPVPWIFEELKNNYKIIANPDRLFFDNSVINIYNGECEFYAINNKQYSENWATQLSSLKLTLIKEHEQFLNNNELEYQKLILPCINSLSLIKKYNITDIEFLKIDAEGLDYDLIKDWPYDKIKPKYLQFEIVHLDGKINSRKSFFSMNSFLKTKGYTFLKDEDLDIIYKRNY